MSIWNEIAHACIRTVDDRLILTEGTVCRESGTVPAGGVPRDEHEDQNGPCVHANLPAAEQKEDGTPVRIPVSRSKIPHEKG